jgi:hypothetical protein
MQHSCENGALQECIPFREPGKTDTGSREDNADKLGSQSGPLSQSGKGNFEGNNIEYLSDEKSVVKPETFCEKIFLDPKL